jgi:hypothetical protein
MPPPGCAPDAFKLVLTNLPGSYTQSDIMSLLQPYGTVVSLTHLSAGELGPDRAVVVWYAAAAQAEAALSALSNTMLVATEGTRQLELKAFKRPAGALSGNRGMQQHRPASMSGVLHPQAQPELAGYHQPGLQPGILQQGGYGAPGQLLQRQQGMLAGEHANSMWLQAGGASAAPPGLTGMGPGGQLAALAAVTAAMSSAPANAYSMQQLLYMLPQQQMGAGMASPGGGTWQGNMLLPGGAVSLSSNSNLDATLQSLQGGADPAMLAPSVSTAGLLAPAAGAGYTGWLG